MTWPAFDPEKISVALFTLLQTSGYPFTTYSRRGDVPVNVPPAQQPYLALIELGGSQVENQAQGLEKWILEYAVMIYLRVSATPSAIPATPLNAAWLAIVNVMRSKPIGSQQTLGGIVDNAWIEGECLINTGIIDQQCRIMIPIKVDCGL